MILDDLGIYIDTNSTVFTRGTNFFLGNVPATTLNTTLTLYEYGGLPPVRAFAGGSIYERVRVQLISRSSRYATARTRAETVYNLLKSVVNSTTVSTTGPRYVQITPVQSPFYIGPDEMNRPQISCNFDVWKEQS